MLRVPAGSFTTSPSSASVITIWQPSREVSVSPNARSSMSSSSSVGSASFLNQAASTMTWQVEQASEPSQAPSMSMPCWCAISSTDRPSGASTSRRVPSRSMKVIFGIVHGFRSGWSVKPGGGGMRRRQRRCRIFDIGRRGKASHPDPQGAPRSFVSHPSARST